MPLYTAGIHGGRRQWDGWYDGENEAEFEINSVLMMFATKALNTHLQRLSMPCHYFEVTNRKIIELSIFVVPY